MSPLPAMTIDDVEALYGKYDLDILSPDDNDLLLTYAEKHYQRAHDRLSALDEKATVLMRQVSTTIAFMAGIATVMVVKAMDTSAPASQMTILYTGFIVIVPVLVLLLALVLAARAYRPKTIAETMTPPNVYRLLSTRGSQDARTRLAIAHSGAEMRTSEVCERKAEQIKLATTCLMWGLGLLAFWVASIFAELAVRSFS